MSGKPGLRVVVVLAQAARLPAGAARRLRASLALARQGPVLGLDWGLGLRR
ncbi:hypothetical protein [Aureimonas sp. N4]|uniref:hypothetical protein n=1 Tax=Aureimonas sp. N4 TaxID=1638165 RepID=UPI00178C928B|nr:hypothetical protein [Aureimonas sp. N4]